MNIEELQEKFCEDLNGRVTTISSSPKYNLIITFQCNDWDNSGALRHFNIICKDVIESDIQPTALERIYLTDTHPLLWNHNEKNGCLYYSSELKNKYETLGRLWEVHENMYQGWRRLTDHVNIQSTEPLNYCSGTYGLLAKGPEHILKQYQNTVTDCVQTNYVPSSKAPEKVFKILLLDNYYVICKSVNVAEYQQA